MVVFSSFMTGSASVAVRIIFCVVSDTGSWHTWTMLILFVSFSTSPLESSQLIDWKNALLSVSARYISGVVHTYPEIRENGIFFFTNMACVHTYPAYFPAVSGNFWKHSPEWKFFYPIWIRIRVDGRIRKFSNTLSSFSWIQSSRRAL